MKKVLKASKCSKLIEISECKWQYRVWKDFTDIILDLYWLFSDNGNWRCIEKLKKDASVLVILVGQKQIMLNSLP